MNLICRRGVPENTIRYKNHQSVRKKIEISDVIIDSLFAKITGTYRKNVMIRLRFLEKPLNISTIGQQFLKNVVVDINKKLPKIKYDLLQKMSLLVIMCNYFPLGMRLIRGVCSSANDINLFLMIFPCMSLDCKLVPVQYREYMHHWFSPQGAVSNDVLATYLHSVAFAEYISLKKNAEGVGNPVSTFSRSVLNSFFKILIMDTERSNSFDMFILDLFFRTVFMAA